MHEPPASTVVTTLPPAEPLAAPPRLLGPPMLVTSGPYNGLKGCLQKQCDTWCSLAIEFDHAWFEIVTELRWLAAISPEAKSP